MPVCPKCHKEISDSKFERHLRRCGESHKKEAAPLSAPSATPSFYWGQYTSGYSKKDDRPEREEKSSRRIAAYIIVAAFIVVAAIIILKF